MKFTPEVVAALAVLRDAAENDFERHRLDVLERDLTAPPAVEIIDDKHQRFDGVIYHRNKSEHFSKFQAIYRDVWVYYYGDIPEGDYQIHHIDGNPANNDIPNLQLLTTSEHQRLHRTKPPVEKICPICGKIFTVPLKQREKKCCSVTCANKLRARSHQRPHDERICPVCDKKFPVPPTNRNQIYCSWNCYAAAKRTIQVKRICPVCGKSFTPPRKNQIYCSKKCSSKVNAQKRYESA